MLTLIATRRFSAALDSLSGSLPRARGCRHASTRSVLIPARSHVAAPDRPRLLRLGRARRSRRFAPRQRRPRVGRATTDTNTKPTDARHDDDARAPPRDDVHRRVRLHRRRVLHLRRRARRRTSRARLRAAPEPEAPVLRYGVRHAGGFLRPGFARPRPRRAVPRRDRPRRALHHRARRRRPILAPGWTGRGRPQHPRRPGQGRRQTQGLTPERRCDISLDIPRTLYFRRPPRGAPTSIRPRFPRHIAIQSALTHSALNVTGHNAATSSSRTTTTSPRTITGDDDEDALGRTGGNSCPLPPCVTECQTKLKKCLLPWKGNEGDDRCGATSAEECLAIFACCINDECKDCPPCVNPDSCIDDCLPGDPGCCCDGFQCEGGTCVPPCVNPDSCTDGCEPGEPGCCCDGSYCSSNDLTCKPGSCETAMAKGASACFPEKSWGWAVELSDTQIGPVEVPIIAAAGGNCESPDQEEVGTASISADGLSVKLTPGPAFSFTEVHIDVQCTQPTTRDAPGQYNWNDLAADLDPCPASDTCTYLSVGSVSGTCLETCGSGPCWFRIHVKACDAT